MVDVLITPLSGTIAISASDEVDVDPGANKLWASGTSLYWDQDKLETSADGTIGGTVASGYIPYASSTDTLADALLFTSGSTLSMWLGATPGTLASANYNTALGYAAGDSVTSGGENTMIGQGAGNALTEGGANTLIGRAAGTALTTQGNNTFIGSQAAQIQNVTANSTFVGALAGYGYVSAGAHMGDQNIGMGLGACQYLMSGANRNIGIGTYAHQGATTDQSSATAYNIAIGLAAMRYVKGGHQNVAIGNEALINLSSGDNNVAIGSYAGQDVTTAAQTVLIGMNAGMNLTTGTYNTVMGYDALKASVGGTYNVALGWMAMRYHSQAAAGYNVALGSKAMYNIDTGINNVVLGDSAMYGKQGTTNSDNVVIGPSALYYASGAINNVAVGSHALNATTTGDNNTAIGLYAGINNTTGDGNVFIGSSAGPSSTNTDDDKLYIHNANGTPLIAGDFSAASVTLAGSLTIADGGETILSVLETGTNSALISGAASAGLYFATDSGTRLELTGNHIIKTGQTIDNMVVYADGAVHVATPAIGNYTLEAMADPSQPTVSWTTTLTLPNGNVGGERYTVSCLAVGNNKAGLPMTGTVKISGSIMEGTNFASANVAMITGATAVNTSVMQVRLFEFVWIQGSLNPSGLGGWVYTYNTL